MEYQLSQELHTIGKVIIKEDKRFSFLSYLLHGKVNILIDTVPAHSADMLLESITSIIGNGQLDAIITNHSEEDHSGALPAVLLRYPGTTVYGTKACKRRLTGVVPANSFHVVRTGDTLALGDYKFSFIETPGMHWDDNMVTFFQNDSILFSNDVFGQLAAADPITDDGYEKDALLKAADTYYTNVFAPAKASEKSIVNAIADLPIKMIAPGHGVILRQYWPDLVKLYQKRATK